MAKASRSRRTASASRDFEKSLIVFQSRGQQATAGPVDVDWLSQARKLGVTALWVGLSLWFLRGLKRSDSFIVSNLMLQERDVLPDAKRRALRTLEKAGLITIELRGKRSPRVTLVVQNSRNGGSEI
jgi:DNA-binding transcriptional ArsR family regulator